MEQERRLAGHHVDTITGQGGRRRDVFRGEVEEELDRGIKVVEDGTGVLGIMDGATIKQNPKLDVN